MLDWLGRKLLYIGLLIAVVWYWLIRERKAAKIEARADELQRVHEHVAKAKKAAEGVSGLNPDDKRERLRSKWSK